MTYEEVLKSAKDGLYYSERQIEKQKMAIDALEKQISKKPLFERSVISRSFDIYKCPICQAEIQSGDYYCSNCGQAIAW